MQSSKPIITEAQAEQRADRMVMSRLSTDTRYTYAENAEVQARAEEQISEEVWNELRANFIIDDYAASYVEDRAERHAGLYWL